MGKIGEFVQAAFKFEVALPENGEMERRISNHRERHLKSLGIISKRSVIS
jgi:hypothetical protein